MSARRVDLWLPPILMMAVIFYFSAQPSAAVHRDLVEILARKGAHATGYAILCFLWWRLLRAVARPGAAPWLALAAAVAYAPTDEFHQTFVAGRHGTPVDVGIDAAGALLVAAVLHAGRARSRRASPSPGAAPALSEPAAGEG